MTKSVTKSELIKTIAEKTEVPQAAAGRIFGAYEEAVMEYLAKGYNVQVVGFGTFKIRTRKAREGRNPQDGKKIMIPAGKVVTFSTGQKLKNAVNGAMAKGSAKKKKK